MSYRFMRLIVMFDLPVVDPEDRRAYTKFRQFLLNDGYDMIQYSIYGRIVNGRDAQEKHLKRLQTNLPSSGSIRAMTVTEKQYAGIKLLVGTRKFQEKKVATDQLLLF